MFLRGFNSILDECLRYVETGGDLDACLSRRPSRATRLRPLLTLAERLRETTPPSPRARVQEASWEQARLRAQDLRNRGWRPLLPKLGLLKPLAITSAFVLLLFAAAGGTAYAAKDSLPDSPLYRVKLATEDVRLLLAFDDTSKAEILLDQADTRTQEIKDLLRSGKPVSESVLSALKDRNAKAFDILKDRPGESALLTRMVQQSASQENLLLAVWNDVPSSARESYSEAVTTLHNTRLGAAGQAVLLSPDDLYGGVLSIAGMAEQVKEGVWRVGGMEINVDSRTISTAKLEAGASAKVVAARSADGELRALSLTSNEKGTADSHSLVSGMVEQIAGNEIVVGGQAIKITQETLLKLQPEEGQQVRVQVTNQPGGAVASAVQPKMADTKVPVTPVVSYEGVIEEDVSASQQTTRWRVGGQTFLIAPATVVDAQGGDLKKGARVRIEALSQSGRLVAQRVIVLDSGEKAESVHLIGVFQGAKQDLWTVSGLSFEPPLGAALPPVGSLLAVEAETVGASFVAREISVLERVGQTGIARLEGLITGVNDEVWILGFARVHVGAAAKVIGQGIVGARALMWGHQNSDGSLEASYLRVLDQKSIMTPRPAPVSSP